MQAIFHTVICTDGNEGTSSCETRSGMRSDPSGSVCAQGKALGDAGTRGHVPLVSAAVAGCAGAAARQSFRGTTVFRLELPRCLAAPGVSPLKSLLLLMSLRSISSVPSDEESLSLQAAVTNDRAGSGVLGKSKPICFA